MTATTAFDVVDVGVVVIGRNEGERLRRCLHSLNAFSCNVVYVDSGSTDGSIALAESKGIATVALDMGIPFTAARARNEGFKYLRNSSIPFTLIQFVDGDCEINATWIVTAATFLGEHPDVACVCGRLRERFPDRSIYNRLCDTEWDRKSGTVDACGGIAMMRVNAFERAGLFNETLVAGEEPELCVRLRAQGDRIWRLSAEMAWHDADMLHFSQWWRRAMRGGYVVAEGVAMYGMTTETQYAHKCGKIIFWSTALPTTIILLAIFHPWWTTLLAIYPLQVIRLARRSVRMNRGVLLGALFQVLASFSEVAGVVNYTLDRVRKRPGKLFEYR